MTCFMPLIGALGVEATVYGLQPRGLDGMMVPHSSVEAAAAGFIAAIKAICPRGPYRLLGHSFGGWVVFEMACQLLAAGEVVEPIVLLDSQPPSARGPLQRKFRRLSALMKLIGILEEACGQSLSLDRRELEMLDPDAQEARLMQSMKSVGLLPRAGQLQTVRGMLRVFVANLNTAYVPMQVLPGRALLLLAGESSADDDDEDPDMEDDQIIARDNWHAAWRDHVALLDSLAVPGNHMTLLHKPNVDSVAGHLWKLWNGR